METTKELPPTRLNGGCKKIRLLLMVHWVTSWIGTAEDLMQVTGWKLPSEPRTRISRVSIGDPLEFNEFQDTLISLSTRGDSTTVTGSEVAGTSTFMMNASSDQGPYPCLFSPRILNLYCYWSNGLSI